MKLDITNTLARSASMVLLPSRQFQDSLVVQLAGQAQANSKQAFLARSPSLNNVRVKKQELAALIRTNKHDTPTNIDISALQTSHTPQSHRNSLTNNRYQKGSNNIVNLELLLLTSSENSSETASFRAMSLGNASSHSTRVGSDTTPNSNPSSVSNYNVNRSESNTPETSISASEIIPDTLTKAERDVNGGPRTSQVTDELDTHAIEKQVSESRALSTVSSHNSSFTSADEFPTDQKLSWKDVPLKSALYPGIEPQLTTSNLSSAKSTGDCERATERDTETNTSSTICSSDKTVSHTSQDDSKLAEGSLEALSPKPIVLMQLNNDPEIASMLIDAEEKEFERVDMLESSRMGDFQNVAPLSPDLQKKLGPAAEQCERTTNCNTTTEPVRANAEQPITEEDLAENAARIKEPKLSLTERRNPGLSISLNAIRQSFVEPSPGAGSLHSVESLPSVLKSAATERPIPISAISYENSPGNRVSFYSPVQIEKFLADDQKEVPPRGDIVMMEVQKRNSSVSSFSSVMPSPKVLQTKSFHSESVVANTSEDVCAKTTDNSANSLIKNQKAQTNDADTSMASANISAPNTNLSMVSAVLSLNNNTSAIKSDTTSTSAKSQNKSEVQQDLNNQKALNVLKQKNGETDIILKNRLSLLNVVNVDFDKSLPASPDFETAFEGLKTPEHSPKRATLPIKPTKSKSEKSATGFRKMFKMFSKSNDSDSISNPDTSSADGNKKKRFHIPLKLSSRLPPTYNVRDLKKLEVQVRESPVKEILNIPAASYDLPALEFEEIFFNDVLLKFDEVEKQAQSEVDLLKKNMSIHNLFIKDDELSKDQIANQQQKDAGNSEEFLPYDTPRSMDYNNVYALSEELVVELPVGQEQALVLSKDDIATILENPRSLTYLFLRYLRQYRDCEQMTVRLTGFDPLDKRPIKTNSQQVSILGKKEKSQNNRVKFADTLHISETFDPDMYKRYNRSVTQYYLTEFAEVNRIKNELNFYKCHEMLVHQRSQCNTHFFY